jgi:hypothetical protein
MSFSEVSCLTYKTHHYNTTTSYHFISRLVLCKRIKAAVLSSKLRCQAFTDLAGLAFSGHFSAPAPFRVRLPSSWDATGITLCRAPDAATSSSKLSTQPIRELVIESSGNRFCTGRLFPARSNCQQLWVLGSAPKKTLIANLQLGVYRGQKEHATIPL